MAWDLFDVRHMRVGGRELANIGFTSDVDVADDLDASTGVPLIQNGALEF